MKCRELILIVLLLFFSSALYSQREFKMQEKDTSYVMKRYVFMLLNEGPNRTHDSATASVIQKGHMAHLNMMAKSGELVLAEPFENGGKYKGLLIFDVDSISQAIRMQSKDPAIVSGRLTMEAVYWWGAKGTKLP